MIGNYNFQYIKLTNITLKNVVILKLYASDPLHVEARGRLYSVWSN